MLDTLRRHKNLADYKLSFSFKYINIYILHNPSTTERANTACFLATSPLEDE